MNCKECDQPMLPKGAERKDPSDYRHARGCPRDRDELPLTPNIEVLLERMETEAIRWTERRFIYATFELPNGDSVEVLSVYGRDLRGGGMSRVHVLAPRDGVAIRNGKVRAIEKPASSAWKGVEKFVRSILRGRGFARDEAEGLANHVVYQAVSA